MAIELRVPQAGESITEIEIGDWLKAEGEWVAQDEDLVVLETDKASMELPAPQAGVLREIRKKKGELARVGEVIAIIGEEDEDRDKGAARDPAQKTTKPSAKGNGKLQRPERSMPTPVAKRMLDEAGVDADEVAATGPGGRISKDDVERHLRQADDTGKTAKSFREAPNVGSEGFGESPSEDLQEEAVPMSRVRRRIAERLVAAQQSAALLTTFNAINMAEVVKLRSELGEEFKQRHGIKLGFMSFFTRATVQALNEFPQLNAEIRGEQIIYKKRYDMGIAVSSNRGLVVPVLRQANTLSMADIERQIADFAKRAQSGSLKVDELHGGTFTISNGGVFGSMMSTPIVNPPQVGVLGLHAIEERPIAMAGQVVIQPMMYIALTYDHRIVDGREAVTFLKRVKDVVEMPMRLLLD